MYCEFTLPYPPALNSLYRYRQGAVYKSKQAKLYQSFVMESLHLSKTPRFASALLSMKVVAYPPDKRKRDIDGILKVLLDSLENAQIYDNDCQIKRLLVEMMPPNKTETARVDITLATL